MAVFVSGCSGKKKNAGMATNTDVLPAGDTEYAMSERFEDGERVTDVTFENVAFGYNQYIIEAQEASKIEAVSQYMTQNTNVRLIAEGHCDERGSREYNVALGENRAQAVRAALISYGIDGARIQTRSYGEERPLDPAHNESAWSANRRVEFALYR
ncbi:MAG: OmpA family protein [Lentisphaerae bacterium]|nr:OmpA family protein [Lentisphaerota bacterium]